MSKNPFEYIAPTEKSTTNIVVIRECCNKLAGLILDLVPESRERSLAITKLEEVSMWVNKGIVFNQDEK